VKATTQSACFTAGLGWRESKRELERLAQAIESGALVVELAR
jgi:hypothetical protein